MSIVTICAGTRRRKCGRRLRTAPGPRSISHGACRRCALEQLVDAGIATPLERAHLWLITWGAWILLGFPVAYLTAHVAWWCVR